MIVIVALRTFRAMALYLVILWLKNLVKGLRRQERAMCSDLES